MAPVRDRYKIFIIDEVHRLSQQAFDALLKSIEEPPPHVAFMMATTEIEKVPATIQSRSQVFELKAIGLKQIADQLRRIAEAEGIRIDDAALMLVARAGDGSMRDAQSALDQVIAFAGETIAADDVSTVLGLVRRDLLIEMAEAVSREDAAAVFDLAGRAVEAGYDLRLVIRELARLTRDVLVVSLDKGRLDDPEIAAESERERLAALAGTFSPEDLMRAFDALTKAEADIRAAAQPRYHLEMALLRWIHLRRLVPLSDLIDGLEKGAPPSPAGPVQAAAPRPAMKSPAAASASVRAVQARRQEAPPAPAEAPAAAAKPVGPDGLKTAFLDEIQKAKKFFYGTVVAQAQKIDVEPGRIVFTFSPQHKPLRLQLETMRGWLEELASRLAGAKVAVEGVEGAGGGGARAGQPAGPDPREAKQAELKKQAMAEPGVQAMLDVFAADIKEVEEM
jgi:DNA polymerase-3 subunit gamma/tau